MNTNIVSLSILFVTAATLSRTMFSLLNDPEGPNLVVVLGAAVVIYAVSLGAYAFKTSPFKKALLALCLQLLVVAALYLSGHAKHEDVPGSFDGRTSSFVIDGEEITLANGAAEREAAPGSASKVVTRYFGNDARGDLNADGKDDVVFLVSQNTGGTGEFYYAVAALATDTGYKTTNAFLIGDRIAPQSTNISAGEIHVNYAERKPGEPMTAQPSQAATLLLKVTRDGRLEGLMK